MKHPMITFFPKSLQNKFHIIVGMAWSCEIFYSVPLYQIIYIYFPEFNGSSNYDAHPFACRCAQYPPILDDVCFGRTKIKIIQICLHRYNFLIPSLQMSWGWYLCFYLAVPFPYRFNIYSKIIGRLRVISNLAGTI